MSDTFLCPFCCSSQQKQEYEEEGLRKVRCASCGCPAEGEVAQIKESAFDRPKVLCIDDDRLLLGLFRDTLETHGFEALTAIDGPTGVEMAKRERPEVILVDVMMPKVSGFEVCRRLRAVPDLATTPIIIMTAITDPALKEKGLEAGADLAIPKPFDPMQIVTVLNNVLVLASKRRKR
jgi:DNA-binding response OmpR family regulator